MKFFNCRLSTNVVHHRQMSYSRDPMDLFIHLHTVRAAASANFESLLRIAFLLYTCDVYLVLLFSLRVEVTYMYMYVSDDDLIGQRWSHR